MGNHRFNPRYVFDAENEVALSMTGVREEDLLRIMSYCEESFGKTMDPRITGVDKHRSDQANTIAALRNGGYTVNSKGEITITFDVHDRRKWETQSLSLQRVKSVFTTASLRWHDEFDPNHYILIRLDNLKRPAKALARSIKHGEDGGYLPLSKADQRFYYLHLVLDKQLNDAHRSHFSRWDGAKRGHFGRVVDMPPAEVELRKKSVKARRQQHEDIKKMLSTVFKPKKDQNA